MHLQLRMGIIINQTKNPIKLSSISLVKPTKAKYWRRIAELTIAHFTTAHLLKMLIKKEEAIRRNQ